MMSLGDRLYEGLAHNHQLQSSVKVPLHHYRSIGATGVESQRFGTKLPPNT